MMKNERFVLPPGSSFYTLYEKRHEPGNGERIDQALHALEEANGTKLRDASKSVFQDISFNTDKLGEEKQKTPSCATCWKTLPNRNLICAPVVSVHWILSVTLMNI